MTKPATMVGLMPAKGDAAQPEVLPGQAPVLEPEPPPTRRGKPARVVRVPLTVKVSEEVYTRLREAAHREETHKQDLIEQALDELLTRMNY